MKTLSKNLTKKQGVKRNFTGKVDFWASIARLTIKTGQRNLSREIDEIVYGK